MTEPDTWTAKEVFTDLKTDLVQHLDRQDQVLANIDRRLDNAATKDDVRELHGRIDGIGDRTTKLEDARDAIQIAADALSTRRGALARRIAWITGSVAVPLVVALILVFIHH